MNFYININYNNKSNGCLIKDGDQVLLSVDCPLIKLNITKYFRLARL
jgi:hypothetical protein